MDDNNNKNSKQERKTEMENRNESAGYWVTETLNKLLRESNKNELRQILKDEGMKNFAILVTEVIQEDIKK